MDHRPYHWEYDYLFSVFEICTNMEILEATTNSVRVSQLTWSAVLYHVYGNRPAGLASSVAMVITLNSASPVAWAGKKHCMMADTRWSASASVMLTGPALNTSSSMGTPGAGNQKTGRCLFKMFI
jgi:hypothetical protein